MDAESRRLLPSIEALRQRPGIVALERTHGWPATRDALRQATASVRATVGSHPPYTDAATVAADVEAEAAAALRRSSKRALQRVINATGVVIHTNLGRAPLSQTALQRVLDVCGRYSTLEFDLVQGQRGARGGYVEELLTALTGAGGAAVVNNNAAAYMLVLAAIAAGREVIISRGDLVEVGGGFRIPDVLRLSGAMLREIGTTNRTRVADYRAAVSEKTALLLRVHPSNFVLQGFTARPSLEEMVSLAREVQLPLVEDLGSGCLAPELTWEPTVMQSLAAGVDVVCCSGDKLLGGPQCGLIVGRRALVDRVRTHPLYRAVRVDKLTLAALEGTLLEYRRGTATTTVPVLRMLTSTPEQLTQRAEQFSQRLRSAGWTATLRAGLSAVGGGSAPAVELPTTLVALTHWRDSATTLQQRLRETTPPVIARIADGALVLDLRTVRDDEEAALLDVLSECLLPQSGSALAR